MLDVAVQRLLVIGDANPDLVLRTSIDELRHAEQEVVATEWELTVGGSSSIFACAAARLGIPTAFAGTVGDDHSGRIVLDGLRDAGVDVAACNVAAGGRTAITVVLSALDDRSILTAASTTTPLIADRLADAVLNATHVHVGGLFVVPTLIDGLPELFALARGAGAATSLDTNWDPSGAWRPLSAFAGLLDYLFVNEQEAVNLAGSPDVYSAAAVLQTIATTVIVKRGAQGAMAFAPGEPPISRAAFSVAAVDTTGAGDNFDAGFIYARMAGQGLEDSLKLACACGALSTLELGGVGARVRFKEAFALAQSRS